MIDLSVCSAGFSTGLILGCVVALLNYIFSTLARLVLG